MGEINKEALFKLGYGVYLVSSLKAGGKLNAQVSNVVFQVTSEPVKLAICINKSNLTYDYIKNSGYFGVSVLSEAVPMTFIGTFGFKSGRDIEKFKDVNFIVADSGTPLITDYAVGIMELKVVGEMDSGSHTLFVWELLSSQVISEATAMSYAYYHEVKKGKSPKSAPTYVS